MLSHAHPRALIIGNPTIVEPGQWASRILSHPTTLQPVANLDLERREQTQQSTTMGRLHSKGKGISSSAIPYSRNPPSWLKTTPEQVVEQICKLAKKGATPSQIGVILRDSHGIAQVKVVTGMTTVKRVPVFQAESLVLTFSTGNKILRILKSNGTIDYR